MRKVVVDRFNGQPLKVSVERDGHSKVYTELQAEQVLAAVDCLLLENTKAKSKRKRPGILDKMTFVVIPNL